MLYYTVLHYTILYHTIPKLAPAAAEPGAQVAGCSGGRHTSQRGVWGAAIQACGLRPHAKLKTSVRFQDSKISRFQDCKISRFPDLEKFQDSSFQDFRFSILQDFRYRQIQNLEYFKIQAFKISDIGMSRFRIARFQDSEILKS